MHQIDVCCKNIRYTVRSNSVELSQPHECRCVFTSAGIVLPAITSVCARLSRQMFKTLTRYSQLGNRKYRKAECQLSWRPSKLFVSNTKCVIQHLKEDRLSEFIPVKLKLYVALILRMCNFAYTCGFRARS